MKHKGKQWSGMATARHGAHGNGRATVRAVASTLRAALRAPPQQARPEKTYDKRRPAACRRAGRAAKRPTSKAETARFAGQDGLFRTAIRRLLQLTEAQAVMPDGHGANKHLQFHHATTGGHGRREPANERKKKHTTKLPFSRFYSLHLQKISGDRETAAEPTHTPTMHFRTPAASLPGTSCTADMKKRDARQGG